MKILIVEDNDIKRDIIINDIKEKYSDTIIEISNNTMSAKEQLRNNSYDILILDLNLPNFEGEECEDESGMLLFKEINRSSKLYNKPADIIIMTAYDNLKEKYEEEIQKGLFSIIKFDSSEEEWKEKLNNRLQYRYEYEKNSGKEELSNEKLIFISHSSEDIDYVKEFVNLLETLGFNSRNQLFCSSLPGYNIPTGENIYDYLKKQFNKQLYVICLLSENYYSSPACMNEMGATWVKSKDCTAILLPEFKYSQLKGAIDASRIWFGMCEKDRINELKEKLENEFNINKIEYSKWQSKLDDYITNIDEIHNKNKYKTKNEKVILEEIIDDDNEESIICTFRFINKGSESKKCKNIDITIEDKNNTKIQFNINYRILSQYTIHKNENRRETIILNKKNIKFIDSFDIYNWKDYQIEDSWTSIF